MAVLLGFDPGGEDGYGWCIADYAPDLPLQIRATGVVDNACDALDKTLAHVCAGEQIMAAGIDAPLFWVPSGDRHADELLRKDLRELGAPSPGGTVQAVNSLRGACLVQGVMTGILLRKTLPSLPITESHPKALLWLLGLANRKKHPRNILLSSLPKYLRPANSADIKEHERDAALATLSARAMLNQPAGWRNLFRKEQNLYLPIELPLGYWMPEVVYAQPGPPKK